MADLFLGARCRSSHIRVASPVTNAALTLQCRHARVSSGQSTAALSARAVHSCTALLKP